MDKVLKKNFIYLFVLQNANYIIPLILLPFLTQTLGAANYGKLAFAQAFIAYFVLFTDFGFNTTSTQSIAIDQNNKLAISKIFWNTIFLKLVFAGISLILLLLMAVAFPKIHSELNLLLVAYIGVISSVLFPVWLFQGIEKMELITLLNIIPKILVLLLTVLFVTNESDFMLALLIQVFGGLLSGIVGLFVVFFKKIVFLVKPSVFEMKLLLKQSWPVFMSGFATSFYTTTNVVVLGFLSSDFIVGVYSAAEKVIRSVIALTSAVTQVTFPRINVYLIESKVKAYNFAKKLLITIGVINLIGAVFIFISAPFVVSYLFGLPDYYDAISLLRISSLMPVIAVSNGIIAVNILIVFNLKGILLKVVSAASLISVVLVFPLASIYGAQGVAVSAIITELFILVMFVLVVNRRVRKKIVMN